jgi:hypothetical protein
LPTNNNIEKRPERLLLAHSGHHNRAGECLLSGVKRTWVSSALMSPPFDPKATSSPVAAIKKLSRNPDRSRRDRGIDRVA